MHKADIMYLSPVNRDPLKGRRRSPDVNEERRERKRLGMTGKQYRKYLKKKRRSEP